MPDASNAVFQILIHGSLEAVWNEITRTDAPIGAFFNNRMHLEQLQSGSSLAMRTGDGKYTGVVGEVLEVIPLKRFSHTFKFTNYDDPHCRVIYDLEQTADGVSFTLTMEDLPAGTKTAKNMVQGGKMIVNTLRAVIETGCPSLGIRVLYGFFKLMAPFSPKRCLSEQWPLESNLQESS